jgi:hypothetical protein
MLVDPRANVIVVVELAEHLVAHGRVPAHHLHLVVREGARLGQDVVGDADLADVVQQGGEPQVGAVSGANSAAHRQGVRVADDAFGVAARGRVLHFDRARQHRTQHAVGGFELLVAAREFGLEDHPTAGRQQRLRVDGLHDDVGDLAAQRFLGAVEGRPAR